jgi:membrane protein
MNVKSLFDSKFFSKVSNDDLFNMAASLSYYTALSLAPLLVLLITFVSFMGDTFKVELINQIQDLVGSQAAEAIAMITKSADQKVSVRNIAGILGLLTLLVSAGGVFGELRASLNKIFDVPLATISDQDENFWQTSRGFLKQKIFNMGMVLTFVFISIVSLLISSGISLWFQGAQALIGQLINFAISAAVFTVLFGAIYFFLPQKKMSLKVSLISGLITAVLFSLGKSLIGMYLGQSAVASAYGAAGSMIVLLMWVYYSSIIIFLSAEITHKAEEAGVYEKIP